LDSRQNPKTGTEAVVLDFCEDWSEEYRASLLLHAALFLFLTALFAWRVTSIALPKAVIPIRLIGPLPTIQAGSGETATPQPGSRLNQGTNQQLSPGRRTVKKPRVRRPVKAPAKAQVKPQPVQPVVNSMVDTNPSSGKPESSVNLPARPYVAPIKPDQIGLFSSEPTFDAPLASPDTSSEELGEPLTMADPELASHDPIDTGRGEKATAPSGRPDASETSGGGEMEIGQIESLAGGSERFEPPSIVSRVLPEYPSWARQQGINGQAVYKVLIQPAGTVGDVMMLSSTIDPKLAIIGSQALRRWVFTPVIVGGEPRETWVRITVQFQLHL
jgi:protein TonB